MMTLAPAVPLTDGVDGMMRFRCMNLAPARAHTHAYVCVCFPLAPYQAVFALLRPREEPCIHNEAQTSNTSRLLLHVIAARFFLVLWKMKLDVSPDTSN